LRIEFLALLNHPPKRPNINYLVSDERILEFQLLKINSVNHASFSGHALPLDEIAAPAWLTMSIDRYAQLSEAVGGTVLKQGHIWFRQGHRSFYRPLLPHRKYDLYEARKQINKFGLFQHGVKDDQPHNCYLNMIVFDRLCSYQANTLSGGALRNLKEGMKNGVAVRRICDPEEFASMGHPVYMSAYRRNQYGANTRWGAQRRDPEGFAKWAHTIFKFPETIVLGAYARGELLSFEIGWIVEDTLVLSTIVHSDNGLALRSPDLLLHAWRLAVRDQPGVNVILDGLGLMASTGVDEFKLRRGGRALALRAYVNINRTALSLIQHIWPRTYSRISGRAPDEVLPNTRRVEPA
jgi:hypothetical protein